MGLGMLKHSRSFIALCVTSVSIGCSEIKIWVACNFIVAGPSEVYEQRFFSPMYPICSKSVRDFTVSKTKV